MTTSLIDAHLFNGFIQIQWPLNLGTALHLSIDFVSKKCHTTSSVGLLSLDICI